MINNILQLLFGIRFLVIITVPLLFMPLITALIGTIDMMPMNYTLLVNVRYFLKKSD